MRRGRRIILWSIFGLNLLIGLTAYLMRDNLFRALIEPSVPFQVDEQPPAPDYNDAAAWAVRPQERNDDTSKADVFFIHPTTAWSGANGWNEAITDPVSRTRLEEVALPNHGEPFDAAGTIWAPRYRQAVLFASLARREDTREALNFAYQDVERAFQAFLNARNPTRPLILVGVGQGGLHALRLLQSLPAGMAQNTVAYLIEQPVPVDLYEGPTANPNFPKPCATSTSTKCFISYIPLDGGDEVGRVKITQRAIIWTPNKGYHALNGAPFACVNPLTGSVGKTDALANENRGSAAATGLERGMRPALLPNETGARCRDGLLLVEVNRPAALSRHRFEMGTFYKLTGYNLFYDALSRDSQRRAEAAMKAGR